MRSKVPVWIRVVAWLHRSRICCGERQRLAALARAVSDRSGSRIAAAVDVERDGKRRVAGAAAGRRRVVADRVRQPRVRDVTGGRWPSPRRQPSNAHTGRRSETAGELHAAAPRAANRRRVHRRSLRSIVRQAAVDARDGAGRRAAAGARQAQPGERQSGHRRRACLRVVRHRPDRGARRERQAGVVEASRQGVRLVRHQWGHASSPVLFQDSIILLCYHSPASYISRSTSGPAR